MPDHGVSGPTRRYALIVGMLVTLASAPTLVILAIGSASMDDAKPSTSPILGDRPDSPVVVVPDGPGEPIGGPSTPATAPAPGPAGNGGIQRPAPPSAPDAPDAPDGQSQRGAKPAAPRPPAAPSGPPEGLPAPGRCGDGDRRHHRDRDHGRRHCSAGPRDDGPEEGDDHEHDGHGHDGHEHGHRNHEHRDHGHRRHGHHRPGRRGNQHRGHHGARGQGQRLASR